MIWKNRAEIRRFFEFVLAQHRSILVCIILTGLAYLLLHATMIGLPTFIRPMATEGKRWLELLYKTMGLSVPLVILTFLLRLAISWLVPRSKGEGLLGKKDLYQAFHCWTGILGIIVWSALVLAFWEVYWKGEAGAIYFSGAWSAGFIAHLTQLFGPIIVFLILALSLLWLLVFAFWRD